jgi:BASS family bile acid:Na+ symporter
MRAASLLCGLGRQARWALPAGVFVGVLLPALAAAARPLLTAAVIGTLTAALLRLDWGELAARARQPGLPLAVVGWLLVGSPLAAWALIRWPGVAEPYATLLVLQAAAPPIGSAAVFALILGVDGRLALVGAVAATMLLPATLTAVVALLLPDSGIAVDLGAFFLRVSAVVLAPFALAALIRRWAGDARLRRHDDALAGVNVLLLVLFAVAVMDGVTATLRRDPGFVLALLALAVAVAAALHAAGAWLFRAAGPAAAWSAALLSGNRNMGLMLVVTAGTAGEAFATYVAVAQVPMYFAPLALAPLAARGRPGRAGPPTATGADGGKQAPPPDTPPPDR